MSPFMALIALAVLIGVVVFLIGLLTRKRKITLFGAPAAVLFVIWIFLASSSPNPEKEFDRLFGSENRGAASAIQTFKPTLMDGHFVSFHMSPDAFDARIRPQFPETELPSSHPFGFYEPLPKGWPADSLLSAKSALYRLVENDDVYLLYFPKEGVAYGVVKYEQW